MYPAQTSASSQSFRRRIDCSTQCVIIDCCVLIDVLSFIHFRCCVVLVVGACCSVSSNCHQYHNSVCEENVRVGVVSHIVCAVTKITKQLSSKKSYKIIRGVKSKLIKHDDDSDDDDDDDDGDDDDDDDDDDEESDDEQTRASNAKRESKINAIVDVRLCAHSASCSDICLSRFL